MSFPNKGWVIAGAMIFLSSAAEAKIAVSPKALVDPTSWVSSEDYPASAMRAGLQGDVRIVLDVDTEGHVACHVAQSSGVPALDDATCTLISARARYEPARDEAGQAVVSTVTRTIRWTLPRTDSGSVSVAHFMSCAAGDRTVVQIETAAGCQR